MQPCNRPGQPGKVLTPFCRCRVVISNHTQHLNSGPTPLLSVHHGPFDVPSIPLASYPPACIVSRSFIISSISKSINQSINLNLKLILRPDTQHKCVLRRLIPSATHVQGNPKHPNANGLGQKNRLISIHPIVNIVFSSLFLSLPPRS